MTKRGLDVLRAAWVRPEILGWLPDLQGALLGPGQGEVAAGGALLAQAWPGPVVAANEALTPARIQALRGLVARKEWEAARPWAEMLLKECETRRARVLKRIIGEVGRGDALREALQHTALFFLESARARLDARFLNVALKMRDWGWLLRPDRAAAWWAAGRSPRCAALAVATDFLLQEVMRSVALPEWRPQVKLWGGCVEGVVGEREASLGGARVVVMSPSRYSLFSMAVMELLHRSGAAVDAVLVCRMLNWARFVREWRRDGVRLLRKIWFKGLLRRRAYDGVRGPTQVSLLASLGVREASVDAVAGRMDARVQYCASLNDEEAVGVLSAVKPDVVVFTGGGLIRKETLRAAGVGVVNCHMGVLPHYRGMDVVEWPILEGHPEAIGLTVHFMDDGIDTGDMLEVRRIDVGGVRSFEELRRRMEPEMSSVLVSAVAGGLRGGWKGVAQERDDGVQYYVMHRLLLDVARAKLALWGAGCGTG